MTPDVMTETHPSRGRRPDQQEHDKRAWELHQSLGTWTAVAQQLGYANGSVARRAGYRYARGAGLIVDIPDTPTVD